MASRSSGQVAAGVLLSLLAIFLVLGIMAFRPVEAGHVGVVTSFGKVQAETLKPGGNWVIPFFNDVKDVDTRVQAIPFDELAAASKEYQDVILSGTLNVHVDSNAAVDLYQKVGLDYADKIVRPFFTNLVKEVVPLYGIADILPKREEIRRITVEKLAAKLAQYGIIVDDVAIANISFSEAYTGAIEEKQVQEQRVQTERQILEQRRIQAQSLVAQAEGEANAAIERARGQAEANRLLAESLSDPIIQYQLIQKLGDKITVMLLPSEQSGLILDLKGLLPTTPPQ